MSNQILLVDDSATVRQLIRLAVADEDIEVIDASTLSAAREHMQRRQPELLLVKISLPDGDGYTFCREVKDSDPDAPVLLLASVLDPVDAERAQASGADGTLTKPFQSIGGLLDTIKSMIGAQTPPLTTDPGDVLELDDLLFVPPMNPDGSTPATSAPLPLTEEQIEQIAERVLVLIKNRLRIDEG